ncbi:hypothetical protein FisN_30Lh107 [Fistulifera solaris]|uniref:Uncharacterized protein n=1 Tax=Fistulifera solaris TaxID=1519565 RepID=A0A1Z5JJ71_FISSO|nr:hypothetical protein FisN_30Lh107 [Fistulifera solaris]|eukprot:GAX13811.1 hypothetical protein FisN_30Lh107 [Fistulifera solaris]
MLTTFLRSNKTMINSKTFLTAIWMVPLALSIDAGTIRGDKLKGATIENDRKRKLFQYASAYPSTIAPSIYPEYDSNLSVLITSPNNPDDNDENKNSKHRSDPAPTPSPTRYIKEKKSNKRKRTPSPTSFPTSFPTFFPTASPTRRQKKNKSNESKNDDYTIRAFPTVSPSASVSPSVAMSYVNIATESPVALTAPPTQSLLVETGMATDNPETTRSPKAAPQISISIVKESPPPTLSPDRTQSTSAPEIPSSDDQAVYYDIVKLMSFDLHLTAQESWHSGFDALVQRALERYLMDSIVLEDIRIHNVALQIMSRSYEETKPDASFRFTGNLYKDPVEDIRIDASEEIQKQQSIALANHLLVQLHLDEDEVLATARVTVLNQDIPNGSVQSNNTYTYDEKPQEDEQTKEAPQISETGRKAFTIIGLIIAFIVAVLIGIWCISPFNGDDDDSYFGKPRESFSQASTDEIRVDHDDNQSVASSLTGTPRDVECSMMHDDNIYLTEFMPERVATTKLPKVPFSSDSLPSKDDDDDQDSFYSNLQPYFYKTADHDLSIPLSSEPSIYSIWKDLERKKRYESVRRHIHNPHDNEEVPQRLEDRRMDESTIATDSFLMMEESTTGDVSLPAAPSLSSLRTPTQITSSPASSISLSESLRQRIASHFAEENNGFETMQ